MVYFSFFVFIFLKHTICLANCFRQLLSKNNPLFRKQPPSCFPILGNCFRNCFRTLLFFCFQKLEEWKWYQLGPLGGKKDLKYFSPFKQTYIEILSSNVHKWSWIFHSSITLWERQIHREKRWGKWGLPFVVIGLHLLLL